MINLPQNTDVLYLAETVQPFLTSGLNFLLKKRNTNIAVITTSSTGINDFHPDIFCANITNVNFESIKNITPKIVIVAGWRRKEYTRVAYYFKNKNLPTICTFDNQWQGSLKQKLLSKISIFTINKWFSYCWVPGVRQFEYAIKLGFPKEKVFTNLLAVDPKYSALATTYQPSKRFVYLGRLIPRKLENLLSAYQQLVDHELQGWELIIAGDGAMAQDNRLKRSGIKYIGFLSETEKVKLMEDGGVFILTSIEEPWAATIQEFGAAGFPMIVSSQCGASDHYIQDKKNGFLVDGNDLLSIKKALIKMVNSTTDERLLMSKLSAQICKTPNSEDWCSTIDRFL